MYELISQQALLAYPEEAVWLVTETGVTQVKNIHPDPKNFFSVSAKDTLEANKAGLKAVIHSHCDGEAAPSKADMESQVLSGIPWGVLNTDGHNVSEITWWGEKDIPPLVGRTFAHGVSDCYSLVRDYYRLKGVELAEVPRDWLWWEDGGDLITESFEGLGFVQVPMHSALPGDVWISQVRSKHPQHCGILLDDELILHHPGSSQSVDRTKLSVIEPIYRYMPYITMFLRLT